MNVRINTLTRVHIGTGEKLLQGNDYVLFDEGQEFWLVLVDQRKVLKLIGGRSEAVAAWVAAIDKGQSVDEFLHAYAGHATVDDYAGRFIQRVAEVRKREQLMPFIHDGAGMPYIPGSSLKGALRTAVVATLAAEQYGRGFPNGGNIKGLAGRVEKSLLGATANIDLFRFLLVGDARFGEYSTQAIRLCSINERSSQSWWDERRSQLMETLCVDDSTTFEMKLDHRRHRLSQLPPLPCCMASLPALFETVNAHTANLLQQEKDYWQAKADWDESGKVDVYLKHIAAMLDITSQCAKTHGRECVLRVGGGSGWRFITGAWSEVMPDFKQAVVPVARKNNQRYSEYDFPKTRRADVKGKLLGFVKLTLLEK